MNVRLALLALTLSCGTSSPPTETGPIDDLPASLPDLSGETDVVVFDLEEQIIPPHADLVLCHFLQETEVETFVRSFESFQGKHGHHLVIFKARKKDTPGTIRDCTNAADMANFTPVIATPASGLREFPPGMAIRVAAGTQIVLQQHYVNTTTRELRIKDFAFMRTVPESEVQVRAGFFGLSDVFLELPPKQESTVEFDCSVPRDMNVLLVGPHMHEWGRRFEATHTTVSGSAQHLIDIEWQADYRDFPPAELYSMEAPLVLREGDLLGTTCHFHNTTSQTLIFPEEMCATYGYFWPAIPGQEEFLCAGSAR